MQDQTTFAVGSIGTVKCPVTEMSQGGWATIESEIHLDPQLAGGLQGLAGFSHILVVFFLDRAQGFDPVRQLMRKPRGRENSQSQIDADENAVAFFSSLNLSAFISVCLRRLVVLHLRFFNRELL